MRSLIYLGLTAFLVVSGVKAQQNTQSNPLKNGDTQSEVWPYADKTDQNQPQYTEGISSENFQLDETPKTKSSTNGDGCGAEPGSLTAVQTPVCLDPIESTAIIEALENTAPTVPIGYETEYLLSEGSEYVIINSDGIPSFEVNTAGTYTIHTLVYNPGTFDIDNDISFGITTGDDIAEMFVQGGDFTCGAIDAMGAQFLVEDCPCEAEAGTLSPVDSVVCLDEASGTADVVAMEEMTPVIPADFEVVYVLTEGAELIIMDTNSNPTFTVDAMGNYTVHTLVYNPATLDLGIIEIGVTSGFDVNDLLVQGGGDICGALDVSGAEIEVCDNTGINERLSQQLSVFPNPSNGQFVIELESSVGQGSVHIVDISGRRVFQRDVLLNGQFRLDVALNVAPGTYVLQIIAPEGTATRTLEMK